MKRFLLKPLVLLSLLSMFGCFGNNKSENDSSGLKIVKNGNITEVYSTSNLAGAEFEINGNFTEKEIIVNPEFLSIFKEKNGKTTLSIASTSDSSSNVKLFSVNSNKFDFKTVLTYDSNSKAVTRAIAPIEETRKCDFDYTKSVNLLDFVFFTKQYGNSFNDLGSADSNIIATDLNGDSSVNLSDLIIFARNYGNFIDTLDAIESLRKSSTFQYYATESLSGIEFLIKSTISTNNIIVDEKTLKIVKNDNGTILALTTSNKNFLKSSLIFSITNCSEPLVITTTKKVPATSTYTILSIANIKQHSTAGNYILKSISDFMEVCGNSVYRTDLATLDFENYDYIASFAGQKPNSGYSLALTSFVETDSSISITYSEVVPSVTNVTLQVITYPYMLIKIPKTSKNIVFTSLTQYSVPKINIEAPTLSSAQGSITLTPEGADSLKYNFADVLNKKSVITINPNVKYTVTLNLEGYAEYNNSFSVQGGDKYIYIDNLTPIQDGIYFNENGCLTTAVSTESVGNGKVYKQTALKSGTLSLNCYVNKTLQLSKSIEVTAGKSYEFIHYTYSNNSAKNRIDAFETNGKIKLDVYSNGWGYQVGRTYISEGSNTINLYDSRPFGGSYSGYFGYASREGYYTSVYVWEPNETLNIKLDPVENDSNLHGTFFFDEGFFADSPIDNTTITVSQNGNVVTSFKTDANGKYSVNLPSGEYNISFTYHDSATSSLLSYNEKISVTKKYHDYKILCHVLAAKPNIYLYPKTTTKMNVTLDFPNSGNVVKSIPDYNTGWNNITVEPNGKINGKYTYLFYESDNRDFSQYNEGWIIKRDNLELFFRKNMYDYGFRGQEIEDFIEYWIPLLKDSSSYAIYPQLNKDISKEVVLNISKKPDSLLRLIYTIKPCNSMLNLKEPAIPAFSRTGFTATEWGVVLK